MVSIGVVRAEPKIRNVDLLVVDLKLTGTASSIGSVASEGRCGGIAIGCIAGQWAWRPGVMGGKRRRRRSCGEEVAVTCSLERERRIKKEKEKNLERERYILVAFEMARARAGR